MVWLALIGSGVGLVLVALLVLPVGLRAEAASAPLHWRVEVRLIAGLVTVPVVDSGRVRKPRVVRAKAAKKAKKAKKARGRPSGRVLRAGARAALEALSRVRIETLRGVARVGLGDPALTGEFYGRAAGLLAALPGRGLRLEPLFDRQAIEGEAELALSLVPARLVPVAARFLWALR